MQLNKLFKNNTLKNKAHGLQVLACCDFATKIEALEPDFVWISFFEEALRPLIRGL